MKIFQFKIKSIVALLGVTMLLSCENSIKEVKSLTEENSRPEQSGAGIDFVVTDSTRLVYRAIAPKFVQVNTDEDKFQEFPEGGELFSYKDDGTLEWQIKANYAKNFEKEQLWEIRSNVEAITSKEEVINTELLYWDQKKKQIYSDKWVRITKKDKQVIEGIGFTADEKFDKIILKKITGDIYLKDQKKK